MSDSADLRLPTADFVQQSRAVATVELAREIAAIWMRSRESIDPGDLPTVSQAMTLIDSGAVRCAERQGDAWVTNRWAKMALDLYYRSSAPMIEETVGALRYRDRFPLKGEFADTEVRVAPPGAARFGSFLSPGVVLMAGYAHLGVWVGPDTLIDTWVTLGTCAQLGARVKILPNSSIVGSLYPLDAPPTIVEDDCYISSGCVVGPGVRVRRGAILAAGVTVAPSTPVIDVTGEFAVMHGTVVPENAIVVGGVHVASNPHSATNQFNVHRAAALVVGYRDHDLSPLENLAHLSSARA